MKRVNKFEHVRNVQEKKDKDKATRAKMVAKVRALFAGFSDDELAILFPALTDELKKGS